LNAFSGPAGSLTQSRREEERAAGLGLDGRNAAAGDLFFCEFLRKTTVFAPKFLLY
jgi:hypothetical protein